MNSDSSPADKRLFYAHQWVDSCRKFVQSSEQQLAQAKRQLEKAEANVRELTDGLPVSE